MQANKYSGIIYSIIMHVNTLRQTKYSGKQQHCLCIVQLLTVLFCNTFTAPMRQLGWERPYGFPEAVLLLTNMDTASWNKYMYHRDVAKLYRTPVRTWNIAMADSTAYSMKANSSPMLQKENKPVDPHMLSMSCINTCDSTI